MKDPSKCVVRWCRRPKESDGELCAQHMEQWNSAVAVLMRTTPPADPGDGQ
jgi:hypothetical protein